MTFETPLGVGALRALRPGGQRRRARASAPRARPAVARRGLDDLVRRPRRPSVPAPAADARAADVERERHDRHRNLVVAATGTGKTVVAALDYRQLRRAAPAATSRCCSSPTARRSSSSRWRRTARCCATARSARSMAAAGRDGPARVRDGPVAAATTGSTDGAGRVRRRRRRRVPPRRGADLRPAPRPPQPKELLGLTATPERLDGQDVTDVVRRPDRGRAAALGGDRPGLPRPVPVLRGRRRHGSARARRGGAAATPPKSSSNLFTNDDLRVAKLLEAIETDRARPGAMRALGFCVSKEHARYMARKFTRPGSRASR